MKKFDYDHQRQSRKSTLKVNSKSKTSEVPSPYSKPFKKPRSLSNSKSIKNFASTASFIPNTKNIFDERFSSKFKKSMIRHSNSEDHIKCNTEDIYKKLLEDIKNLNNPDEEFEIYQKYFAEVIRNDKKHGEILLKIKSCYDFKISFTESNLIAKLKAEIKDYQNKITKEHSDKQLFLKKFEKLAKENVELSRNLEYTQSKYNELNLKLSEITRLSLHKIPKDEIT
jgi:hypothetical protein